LSEKILKAAALRYEKGKDNAPKVIAKGQRKIAEKIIEIAKKENIPIKEDEELVEILSSLDINEEIPPQLYEAVAKILAFIYKNSKKF
jgi:flagellar biosynthesis protein